MGSYSQLTTQQDKRWEYNAGSFDTNQSVGTHMFVLESGGIPSDGLFVMGRVAVYRSSGTHASDGWALKVRRRLLDGTISSDYTSAGDGHYATDGSANNPSLGNYADVHPKLRVFDSSNSAAVVYPSEIPAIVYWNTAGAQWIEKIGFEYWVWE